MPKKFKGENSKAVEAKLRKNAAKEAENERKKQEEEDELWKDNDKSTLKKQQRKDNKEKKKQETSDKKQQLKDLYNSEMMSIKSNVNTPQTAKVTRAQIQERLAREEALAAKQANKVDELPIEENVNHLVVEGDAARNVDEAISILSIAEEKVDRHPEKRVKAAYAAYEEAELPRLKEENPNLKLSQLKQILRKEWCKSPQNPVNVHQ